MTANYEIGKPRQDKKRRITILVCIGKTKKRIKTDLFATTSDLNRKGLLRTDAPIYNKVRARITEIERAYGNLDTFLTGEKLSAATAVERMQHTEIPSFFEYAEDWIAKAHMKGLKNYKTALRNFRSFLKGDIRFSSFSHKLLDDYKYSLRDLPRAQSQYISAIKKIYTDAEKDYMIPSYSSYRFNTPRQMKSAHRALTKEELQRLFSYSGNLSRAILARDCCLLSFFFCGINSVDLYEAPKITKGMLRYNRAKTKDRREDNAYMEITIPPQAKALVKKYQDTQRAFSFYRRYSSYSTFNTAINKGLKEIEKEIGLEGLTFYAIRHSWATIARNDLGIEKYTIHEALCHQSRDTAIDDIYIKKDFRLINEANQRVIDYVL